MDRRLCKWTRRTWVALLVNQANHTVSGHPALISILIEPLVNGHVLVKMFATPIHVPRNTGSFFSIFVPL